MVKINIKAANGVVEPQITKGSWTINEMFQVMFTVILGFMNQFLAMAHPDDQAKIRSLLYDNLNLAASRTLEAFAPEYELRPNLTAQAILEAENAIIMEDRLDEVEAGS